MQVIPSRQLAAIEPMWDMVGIHSCDFRPHFDGDLVNLYTTALPLQSVADTERQFRRLASEIANWIVDNQHQFGSGDRFQIIVGWPKTVQSTQRQVIKAGGDLVAVQGLARNPDLFQLATGWTESAFAEPGTAGT